MAARWFGRLACVAFGLLVGMLMLEVGLRLTRSEPWYDRLVSEQLQPPPIPYRRNANGLRDRNYEAKGPGVRRILILGDSFTYGSGVASSRGSWRDVSIAPFVQATPSTRSRS